MKNIPKRNGEHRLRPLRAQNHHARHPDIRTANPQGARCLLAYILTATGHLDPQLPPLIHLRRLSPAILTDSAKNTGARHTDFHLKT